MHTLALLAVEIPEVQEDEKMDEKISADINKMEKQFSALRYFKENSIIIAKSVFLIVRRPP